jgi:leucyl/phenylalanyl-tRNA---protein transferase
MKRPTRGPAAIPSALLLDAYRQGWFPMGERGASRLDWFSPDPRGVLPLDGYHAPARLARRVRQGGFRVSVDTVFPEVIRQCAARRDETWISDLIVDSYCELHRLGYAHAVEVWRDEALVGGLYGVALGGAFFGESMFHLATDASKVALHVLVERLRARGFTLLDIQWVTPHLAQFGAVAIPRAEYLERLAAAVARPAAFL